MANHTSSKIGLLAALALWWGSAQAQSFNIDIDSEFGPPQAGAGAPSFGFGAAANQEGTWNKIPAENLGNTQLRGLDGALTSARIVQGGLPGGSGGAFNLSINTGDYALLLNDARSVGWITSLSFSITGLQNGIYDFYTYSTSIATPTVQQRTRVSIFESTGPVDQISTGPMPGNALFQGITHTKHRVLVSADEVNVNMISLDFGNNAWFNGMQIVHHPVPEPLSLISLTSGFLILIRRGRQRRERA